MGNQRFFLLKIILAFIYLSSNYKLYASFNIIKILFNSGDIVTFVKSFRYKHMDRKFLGVNFLGI